MTARSIGRAERAEQEGTSLAATKSGGRLELVASRLSDTEDVVATSHNLAGQRLGRKGRQTRERIVTVMLRLCEEEPDVPVTLTNVAKRADVRLSALYLYFPDLEALLLAALERVTATADTYIDLLRQRWPDRELGPSCLDLVRAYHLFWTRHTRILHLRNALSETDSRLYQYRQRTSQPLRVLMLMQMDAAAVDPTPEANATATVLVTGLERLATVITDVDFGSVAQRHDKRAEALIGSLLQAEARVLELAIADQRASAAPQKALAATD